MKVLESNPKKLSLRKKLSDKKYSIQFLPQILLTESKSQILLYEDKRIKPSYLIDIIHNLILKYYFKKDNMFNLSSVVLKEKYGHLYNYYIKYLVDKGILNLVKNYQVGVSARVYKINESVLKSKITRFKNQDRTLLKKYREAIISIEKHDYENNVILPEIKKKLVDDLFHIEIEFDRAIFYLDSTIQDTDIYNKNKFSVECIQDDHIFYHFDNYGRMHTNFTILKSFIRKNCLKIDGEETCEIDIKNSQPLFLTKLIEDNPIVEINQNEFQLFKYLTYNGKFYEFMMDKTNIKEKKQIKEIIYKVFFGKNYKNQRDEQFQQIFPSIYNFIRQYKKTKNDYRILAYDLQKLESNLIFNKIVKELSYVYPEVKVVTVHDSIICSKKYKEIVEKIFNENLKKEFIK